MWGILLNVIKTALWSPFTWLLTRFAPKALGTIKSILQNGLNIAGWLVLIEELGKKIIGFLPLAVPLLLVELLLAKFIIFWVLLEIPRQLC